MNALMLFERPLEYISIKIILDFFSVDVFFPGLVHLCISPLSNP